MLFGSTELCFVFAVLGTFLTQQNPWHNFCYNSRVFSYQTLCSSTSICFSTNPAKLEAQFEIIRVQKKWEERLSSEYSGANTGVAGMERSFENNPGEFKEVATGSEF